MKRTVLLAVGGLFAVMTPALAEVVTYDTCLVSPDTNPTDSANGVRTVRDTSSPSGPGDSGFGTANGTPMANRTVGVTGSEWGAICRTRQVYGKDFKS
jgi:hypothetical protein